jgi:hypothetical protein
MMAAGTSVISRIRWATARRFRAVSVSYAISPGGVMWVSLMWTNVMRSATRISSGDAPHLGIKSWARVWASPNVAFASLPFIRTSSTAVRNSLRICRWFWPG